MLENKKNFESNFERKEEIRSPKDNMDKFNKNEKDNKKITEIKVEKKIEDRPVLQETVIRSEATEAPIILEHQEKTIVKQEQLATDVQQHAVAHDVIQVQEAAVVEQEHREVIHEHHQDVVTEQHKNVIHEHHQKVIHKHIQPIIKEEIVTEIHRPVIHEKQREVIHEIHKPIVHEEHVTEFVEQVRAPVYEQVQEKTVIDREVLPTVVDRVVEEARVIEQPLPQNLQSTIITQEVRSEKEVRREEKEIRRDFEQKCDVSGEKEEKLSSDELIKLRVKGALESLKNKVIEGEGRELMEKNVMTKEVQGEEIVKID